MIGADLKTAVLAWAQIYHPETSFDELYDVKILQSILTRIDAQWFKLPLSPPAVSSSWISNYHILSRIMKNMQAYFFEVLGKSLSSQTIPNLTLVSRDLDEHELMRLYLICITLSVQSERKELFINDLRGLNEDLQTIIMVEIEPIIKDLDTNDVLMESESLGAWVEDVTFISTRPQTSASHSLYEEEKKQMQSKINDLQTLVDQLKTNSVDKVILNENESLKSDLELCESQNRELQDLLCKEKQVISELRRKNESVSGLDDEIVSLKNRLEELQLVCDSHSKNEAQLEKYKVKLNDAIAYKDNVLDLEKRLQESTEKCNQMEDQIRKYDNMKSMLEAYKCQISNLEEKNNILHVDNTTLSFQVQDAAQKFVRYEAEKARDFDKIAELQEQLRDMGKKLYYLTNYVESNTATFDSVPVSSGVDNTKILTLESENQRLKTQLMQDSKKIQMNSKLENDIIDLKELCEKYEANYKMVLNQNLTLQAKVDQLSASDAIFKKEDFEKSIKLVHELKAINESLEMQLKNLSLDHETLRKSHEEISNQLETQKTLNKFSKTNFSNVNASLSVLERADVSTDETTQNLRTVTLKIVKLTEQNTQLHTALKRAKEVLCVFISF